MSICAQSRGQARHPCRLHDLGPSPEWGARVGTDFVAIVLTRRQPSSQDVPTAHSCVPASIWPEFPVLLQVGGPSQPPSLRRRVPSGAWGPESGPLRLALGLMALFLPGVLRLPAQRQGEPRLRNAVGLWPRGGGDLTPQKAPVCRTPRPRVPGGHCVVLLGVL